MNISITNVNLRYRDEEIDTVDIRFEGQGDDINLSGHFSLDEKEYKDNNSTDKLVKLVKSKLEIN